MTESPLSLPVTPTSLMRGMLYQSSQGGLHVTDNLSDSTAENGNGNRLSFSSSTQVEAIDFLKDDRREMTWGRRIALSLISSKWYNPKAGEAADADDKGREAEETCDLAPPLEDKDEIMAVSDIQSTSPTERIDDFDEQMSDRKPNLEKAWAYFEHVALYRYLVPPGDQNKEKKNIFVRMVRKFMKANKKLEKAEPGENGQPTRLYDPIFTPHKQLGDFGLGIGLYFSTLRAITFLTLVSGLISIYNIMYFSSEDYQPLEYQERISTLQRGSAICTKTTWVPCPDCNCTQDSERNFGTLPLGRCGVANSTDGEELRFALRNDCNGTPWQLAAVNYSTVIFMLVATILMGEYLRRQEVQFDEDEQTAQDYSIQISNPPADAKNPEEWRRFFAENCDGAQVVVCTCAVHNDFLVRTLVERRERLRTIHNSQEPGSSMRMLDLARVAAEQERSRNFWGRLLAAIVPGIPEHFARLVALNAKVEGLAQLDYPVTNVFVTFETEKDQRHVLEKLTVGSVKSSRNDKSALSDPKYLFRGQYVLAVSEPEEPNTIRWQDLNAGWWQKTKERSFTFFCTAVAIVVVAVLVNLADAASTVGAAFTIAVFSSIFPIFAKVLTTFESHPSEGQKQTSLYFKIALFRWVSTAVVISIITPFTSTLTNRDGLITQVYALFFADIVTTNAIQLADPVGHLQRHILAPRAATQDAMNLAFQGAEYELAERYTDMTKILFLAVWYCSIYPAAFFMCSFSLFIKYFVDRFCLMRTWKRAPHLGTKISKVSRKYFFSVAIGVMAIISSYYWSGFPYDNICPNDNAIDPAYVGEIKVISLGAGQPRVQNFTSDDVSYGFCNQNFLARGSGFTFPFVPTATSETTDPDEWMTEDQKISTTYFGWSAVGICGLILLRFCMGWWSSFRKMYHHSHKAVGSDQNVPYSEVASRSAYIPQVASPLFAYPLIACDSSCVDDELYEWTDPDRTYSFYDLSKDAKKLLLGITRDENVGFTIVKHWPPNERGDEVNQSV